MHESGIFTIRDSDHGSSMKSELTAVRRPETDLNGDDEEGPLSQAQPSISQEAPAVLFY